MFLFMIGLSQTYKRNIIFIFFFFYIFNNLLIHVFTTNLHYGDMLIYCKVSLQWERSECV